MEKILLDDLIWQEVFIMAQGKVEICGVNTAKLPILKEEEKEALFARIKQGDQQAKEEYIKGNLRLVLSVIKRFGASNENPDDLFQIGCIGLINAKENYVKQHQKEPTVQEIAQEIGISKEDIVFALDAIQVPMSLQEPVYNDGGDALYVMDQLSDTKNKEDKWVENLSLEAAMEHLSERERYIIRLRFFEGRTQMEVAREVGISQAQVSRLEKNALKTMRQYLS